jgi:hypothetical protein
MGLLTECIAIQRVDLALVDELEGGRLLGNH